MANNTDSDFLLDLFFKKMNREQCDLSSMAAFSHYYRQLCSGHRGMISEDSIIPINNGEVPQLSELASYAVQGKKMLPNTVVIKLNGGLGTTMGCNGPKSLLEVKNGLCFLDLAIKNTHYLRNLHHIELPLVLMNSFITAQPTDEYISHSPPLSADRPINFIQNKFPKVNASTMLPAENSLSPIHEWNPSGHGDIYMALYSSGVLSHLLEKKYQYAFISNIDNLGAVLDMSILGFMAENSVNFLMEVAPRTHMDRKGGHLARLKNGKLVLREVAQCPQNDLSSFIDVTKHSYFNTNNLWIDLFALQNLLENSNGMFVLPMICNQKTVDPADQSSPQVFQLESAMGSAITLFSSAEVVAVPRSRFLPVKTTEDLLLLWSDLFTISDDFSMCNVFQYSPSLPSIKLDPQYYSAVDQLVERFPSGPPSLKQCDLLSVSGDIFFGRNISISGNITISNRTSTPYYLPDNLNIDRDLIIQ